MASIAEKLTGKIKQTTGKKRKTSKASLSSLSNTRPITKKAPPKQSHQTTIRPNKIIKLTAKQIRELDAIRLESFLPPAPPEETPPKVYNPWIPKHIVQEIDPPYSKRKTRQQSPLVEVPFTDDPFTQKEVQVVCDPTVTVSTVKAPVVKASAKNLNEGHRSRLRDRVTATGWNVLADYELLELLLTYAQPRKNMKPLAKILLSTFRGLAGVFTADVPELIGVRGIGDSIAALIKITHGIMIKILREEAQELPCLDNIDGVVEYCRGLIGHASKEINLILFLDAKNFLLDTEMRSEGTVDHVHTYPREIISKALECKAKSIIMVHNHPSGDPTPSREDLEITNHVKTLSELMDINLHDHLILSRDQVYSMRANGDI